MGEFRVLEIKQSVFADNDRRAKELRKELKEKKVFLLNLMSSPGSGKTTTLSVSYTHLNSIRFPVDSWTKFVLYDVWLREPRLWNGTWRDDRIAGHLPCNCLWIQYC